MSTIQLMGGLVILATLGTLVYSAYLLYTASPKKH